MNPVRTTLAATDNLPPFLFRMLHLGLLLLLLPASPIGMLVTVSPLLHHKLCLAFWAGSRYDSSGAMVAVVGVALCLLGDCGS